MNKQALMLAGAMVVIILTGAQIIGNSPVGRSLTAALGGASLNATDTIKIGAALGLSGGDCATYGEGELKATHLAIEEANAAGGVNGRQLELIAEDTLCDPKGSVNAVKKLVEVNHAKAIIGLTWGDSYQAGFTVSNAGHIIAVAPSAALEALYYNNAPTDYVFSTWFPEKAEVDTLQGYARKIGVKEFVVVHDEDPYGAMLGNLFAMRAGQNGVSVAQEFRLPVDTADYRTIIARIKNLKPDGVAIFFNTPTSQARFLKQAHELGLKAHVFTDASVENPSLLANFGGAMEGLTYTYPEITGDKRAFFAAFKKRYGTDSQGASDANAYDAARVVIAALKEHYENGTDLKTAVERTDIPGAAVARITFDSSHQITGAHFQVKTVRGEKFVVVE